MSRSTREFSEIGFSLEVEGDWPPYSVEHLWVQPVSDGYIIKSFPFFVKGLSFGDTVSGNVDQNGYISDWKIIHQSDNSTIWIICANSRNIIDEFVALGCGSESGAVDNLFTVNIPKEVPTEDVERILEHYDDDEGVSIAYPAYRR